MRIHAVMRPSGRRFVGHPENFTDAKAPIAQERGAVATLCALELSAIDVIAKPGIGAAHGLRGLANAITEKIRIASKLRFRRAEPRLGGARASVLGCVPTGTYPAHAPSARTRPADAARCHPGGR